MVDLEKGYLEGWLVEMEEKKGWKRKKKNKSGNEREDVVDKKKKNITTTPRHATPHHTTPHHTTPHHTIPHDATSLHTTPHHTTFIVHSKRHSQSSGNRHHLPALQALHRRQLLWWAERRERYEISWRENEFKV